jgi:prefoldin alpha subunit
MDKKEREKEGGGTAFNRESKEGGSEAEAGGAGHENEGGHATFQPQTNQEKEMQEKVILYQLLQRHLESLSQNAVMLERRYEEIEATRMALEDIEKLKEKSEILVPLGSGLFTYGKILDSKRMLVDAGAGVFMDKDPDSSKRLLEDKRKELEKLAKDMQDEIMDVSSRLNSIAMELEDMSQEQEHKEKKHHHKHE